MTPSQRRFQSQICFLLGMMSEIPFARTGTAQREPAHCKGARERCSLRQVQWTTMELGTHWLRNFSTFYKEYDCMATRVNYIFRKGILRGGGTDTHHVADTKQMIEALNE